MSEMETKPYEVVVKGRDLVIGYACPRCRIFHGATIYACRWEDAVIASREAAERCCNRKCEDCGVALDKEYRIACIPCQRAREAARELVAFDKAEKVPESKYDGWLSYRNEYYQDTDALQDHCEQNDLEWPAWVWSCSQTELSLDVDSILESALENHYEDARDSIGQAEEDKLQALLDEWCANQKIVSWEEDQSRAVILGPRELEKEDESESVPEKEQQAVVAYILRDNGKVLSVTRKDTGQHSAPGGKVEPGETRLEAVARETDEEVGIKIINPDCVHEGLHKSGRRLFSYLVTRWTGEPVAREPGTSVAWVDPIEIVNGFGGERAREALIAAGVLKP